MVITSSTSDTRTVRGRRGVCALLSVGAVAVLCATVAQAGVGSSVDVAVVEDSEARIVLSYSFGDYASETVSIDGCDYTRISLRGESQIVRCGAPDLPNVCRSVIIPDDAAVAAKVVSSDWEEIKDVLIAPSKGSIPRSIDPTAVPFTFGKEYQTDAEYPGEPVTLGDPYIMRDYRGVVVMVNPFQYNPVTRTLRVCTDLTVELSMAGPGVINVLNAPARERALSRAFHEVYRHQFLNYGGLRYDPLDEEGELLIICHDDWLSNVEPLVEHKESIGIETTLVGVSTIGNNASDIASYVQDVYDTTDLAFVLLVGDVDEVATPTAVSGYNGAADPTYAKLAGDDNYPEIMIGRFSAETSGDVDTQVERTIEYELMPATTQDWFWKGTGVASNLGIGDDGEYDDEHIDNIRDDLLAYGYTEVDQIYAPSATAAMVSAALNEGRGIVNYCGHGTISGWSTTGFSTSHVNSLANDNMLPFIVTVACNNGEFDGYTTCFAEAWLRATNGSEPTGAIACYASSISQPWSPPMEGQDEFNLLYVAESYHSYGALCYAGSCSMMDDYPGSESSWGTGAATFITWHIFGDPSLRVVGVCEPPTGLKVTGEDLVASGQRGGPFTPDSAVYTLENRSETTALDYEVTASVDWVDITNASGTLPGLGTIDVTVSFNEAAGELLHGLHEGTVFFTNLTDHDGDSELAVSLDVDDMAVRYTFPFDSDPGWTTTGDWAFGVPSRGGSHDGDPDGGYTGDNVYGYNLDGDYPCNMPEYYLTTSAIDCTHLSLVELRFWRWLGVEKWDEAAIEVSSDGSNWTQVWSNPDDSTISDREWTQVTFDVSEVADGAETVYVRWQMGPTDDSVTYPGWNIDDVEIWGASDGQSVEGDLDGDGDVDLQDLAQLLANYGTASGAEPEDGDLDGDGDVDLSDLSILLANYGAGQ